MNNLTFGDGEFQYYETICGGTGAGPGYAGTSAVHSHMTNSRLTDVEILESRMPVRVETFQVRRGSGGAGRWPGGDGVVREVRFLRPLTVTILSNNRRCRPFGLAGGSAGSAGSNAVLRQDGSREILGAAAQFDARAGDVLRIETPGGGGYGSA
jgi:5-oxoprolinase (ATP-hydrolysing)